ncbi:MAG: DedA family protein/thiosulfate sulfurtransferase GlpE [Steroidobacteraceae bacterium]|jgi:membrane protein DedA with SNARE-associated domain/rhodanese-related sulfurtransferase
MSQNLVWLITEYGLLIVTANVFVDQLGLPVPAMPTLILAGAIASGALGLTSLFAASVLACIVPDCVWFLVGRRYGIRVLKTLCRISLEPDSCVSQTQSRFERWGINSLVIAKFVPGLAIIAPPLAGALRIGWPRFIGLSALGGALWVGSGLLAGMLFKTQIQSVLVHLDRIGSITGTVVAAALVGYVFYKWWERRRFYKELRMARISVAELYELMEAGEKPIVVDVRSPTARTLEPRWIPGAIHVPVDDVGRHVAELPRDRKIIVYCTCPSEASAARVAKALINHGFKEVRPLYGGLDAWIQAGYAVDGTQETRS